MSFRAGVWAALYHFFAANARTDVEVTGDVSATFLPERPFSFTIYDEISRNVRPFTEQGADDRNYGRIHNDAGARLDFGTSGGILRGNVGYRFRLDVFEGSSFSYADNFMHSALAGASWKFLPQTALLYDFALNVATYPNTSSASLVLRSDMVTTRSRIGVNGAITNRISLMGMVGYHGGFYDQGDDFNDFVAQAELRFQLATSATLSIGYDRDYQRSTFGNFFRRDRGYASLQLLLAGALLIGLEGGVGVYDFGAGLDAAGAPLGVGGTAERSDVRVDASLFAEYRIQDWIALNATATYNGDFTDFEFQRVIMAMPVTDPANWQKFQVWGGVRVFY